MALQASGASAVLDNLFYVIGDAGEGVLIPAPYYPAFDNDLQVGGCVCVASWLAGWLWALRLGALILGTGITVEDPSAPFPHT
jgi:aspartate/methionine/tyrosine aminotransferase